MLQKMMSSNSSLDLFPVTQRLNREWNEKIESSLKVKQIRKSLRLHKLKMNEISEELGTAEKWERELRAKYDSIQEGLKPGMMKFAQMVENDEDIGKEDIEKILAAGKWKDIVIVLKHKEERVTNLERGQLVRFVMTVVKVRDAITSLYPELEEAVEIVQNLAVRVLKQMGSDRIVWSGLSGWEAEIVRKVVPQIKGIPMFVIRIIDWQMMELEKREEGTRMAGHV